jgi:hypothetical protein
VNLDTVDIVELGRGVDRISNLFLDANLAILIKLAGKEDMVARLDLEVVNAAKRVDHALLVVRVYDLLRILMA